MSKMIASPEYVVGLAFKFFPSFKKLVSPYVI
jgi:hypothetical protein